MTRFEWALGACLLICSGCSASSLPVPAPVSAPSPLLGRAAPDFSRPTLAGDRFDTKAARGKVMLVKFFAKYCEPCKRTLPEAEASHRSDSEIVWIGIAEDERESDARELVRKYGLTFPVVHDTANVLSGRYRVSDMPITFVVDARGVVRFVAGARTTADELARAVDAAKRPD